MSKESQNIEWKSSWQDEYLKWICGFANAQGGRIYIGRDDTGKVIGVFNARKLLEDLPNKIRDRLGLMPQINLLQKNGENLSGDHRRILYRSDLFKRILLLALR